MKLKVYNKEGKELEKMEVLDSVFGVVPKPDLIHTVFVSISARKRSPIAHTKTRGERAGSGIKPWRQKGTGRARVGSVRNPVWKKGGVVFGPRSERNYSQKINQKTKARAITMVLSGKCRDKELIVLDKIDFSEKKTRAMVEMIKNLKITGKILMAFSEKEKKFRVISRNIPTVENILTNQLNVFDMLNNRNLVISKESVKYIEDKYKNLSGKNLEK